MNLVIVGLNHKTAPIEIRERLSFPAEAIGEPLKRLVSRYGLNEAVILSTCNRVEAVGIAADVEKGAVQIKRFLSDYHSIPIELLNEHLYIHSGQEAATHLFRVASGLDSQVFGEPQILGQVKDSYGYAVEHGSAGAIINKLYHKVFQVAKRVRTETRIGESAVSISFAAVELARKIFGALGDKSVMLIGAGEMAELAAKHLMTNGVKQLFVANRTYERAVEFAKGIGATAIMLREFPHYLKDVDIVIASTASTSFIIRQEHISEAMRLRKFKPMFFIDIAVPRNIDPLVNNIDGAYVYDVDDLSGVVEANLQERKKEADAAELIISEEIEKFYRWIKTIDVVPTIIALRRFADEVRKTEIEKAAGAMKNLSDDDKKVIDAMTNAIVNKILHNPIVHLKKEADKIEGDRYIDTVRKLFDLEDDKDEIEKAGGDRRG